MKLFVAVLLSLFSCLVQAEPLRVGVDPNLKPFVYMTPDQGLMGFDVAIANEICHKLQRPCEFVPTPWDSLIIGLQSKKLDVVISSMSITAEREQAVDFTQVYYVSPSQLLARKGQGELQAGQVIGALRGSTDGQYAREVLGPQGIKVVEYENQNEAFLDLNAGRIVGVLSPKIEAAAALSELPMKDKFAFTGPLISDEHYFGPGIGMAVRSGNAVLLAQLNQAITEIHADPKWAGVSQSYFGFNIFKPQ